eukprot:399271_1
MSYAQIVSKQNETKTIHKSHKSHQSHTSHTSHTSHNKAIGNILTKPQQHINSNKLPIKPPIPSESIKYTKYNNQNKQATKRYFNINKAIKPPKPSIKYAKYNNKTKKPSQPTKPPTNNISELKDNSECALCFNRYHSSTLQTLPIPCKHQFCADCMTNDVAQWHKKLFFCYTQELWNNLYKLHI